jgi:hypothetical protein
MSIDSSTHTLFDSSTHTLFDSSTHTLFDSSTHTLFENHLQVQTQRNQMILSPACKAAMSASILDQTTQPNKHSRAPEAAAHAWVLSIHLYGAGQQRQCVLGP